MNTTIPEKTYSYALLEKIQHLGFHVTIKQRVTEEVDLISHEVVGRTIIQEGKRITISRISGSWADVVALVSQEVGTKEGLDIFTQIFSGSAIQPAEMYVDHVSGKLTVTKKLSDTFEQAFLFPEYASNVVNWLRMHEYDVLRSTVVLCPTLAG